MTKRLPLSQALMMSVLLHAGLFGGLALSGLAIQHPSKPQRLTVDLRGLLAEQQQVEKQKAVAHQTVPDTPLKEKVETPKPPDPIVKPKIEVKNTKAPSPVHLAETPRPRQVEAPPAAPSQATNVEQVQKTLNDISEEDREKLYAALLAKIISRKASASQEVRKSGLNGTTVIAFTVDTEGAITAGSLRVVKSSGYPFMDDNAIATAQMSAPFPKTKKQIDVEIPIKFTSM